MALSTYTSKPLEDVIKEGRGNPYMMHICFFKDRTKTLEIIKRAEGKPLSSAPNNDLFHADAEHSGRFQSAHCVC